MPTTPFGGKSRRPPQCRHKTPHAADSLQNNATSNSTMPTMLTAQTSVRR